MDPNYKEEEESGSSSNAASGTSGPVKLDAAKTKPEQKKKGCC